MHCLTGFREWEGSTRNESEKIDVIGWSMFAGRVAANNLTINRVWGKLSQAVTARIRELPKQLFVTAVREFTAAHLHFATLQLLLFRPQERRLVQSSGAV